MTIGKSALSRFDGQHCNGAWLIKAKENWSCCLAALAVGPPAGWARESSPARWSNRPAIVQGTVSRSRDQFSKAQPRLTFGVNKHHAAVRVGIPKYGSTAEWPVLHSSRNFPAPGWNPKALVGCLFRSVWRIIGGTTRGASSLINPRTPINVAAAMKLVSVCSAFNKAGAAVGGELVPNCPSASAVFSRTSLSSSFRHNSKAGTADFGIGKNSKAPPQLCGLEYCCH